VTSQVLLSISFQLLLIENIKEKNIATCTQPNSNHPCPQCEVEKSNLFLKVSLCVIFVFISIFKGETLLPAAKCGTGAI
jgi:hypothetical protein